MATTENIGERVSRLEGGYEHLATKADIAQMETRMDSRFSQMEVRFAKMETQIAQLETRLFLRIGTLFIATAAVMVAILRLLE